MRLIRRRNEVLRARAATYAARLRLEQPLLAWQRRLHDHPLVALGGGAAAGVVLGASERHHRRVLIIMRALGRGSGHSLMRLFAYARTAAAMAQN